MKAWCPGHVTGFFVIEDVAAIPEKKGSRGVGFCTELGAIADVQETDGLTSVSFGEDRAEAPVTKRALQLLAPDAQFDVRIDHQAPMGQGFGMSAAGTFAACLAAAVALDIKDPKYAALKATHIAEVENRTGLGDAVAQSLGGFVHRLEPGVPPHGELQVLKILPKDVVFCILGPPIKTSAVLADQEMRARIKESGELCLRDFEWLPGFDEFVGISWVFARDSGLATERMAEALESLGSVGKGSMVMLGNCIFAFGDAEAAEKALAGFGTVIRTNVTMSGPCII